MILGGDKPREVTTVTVSLATSWRCRMGIRGPKAVRLLGALVAATFVSLGVPTQQAKLLGSDTAIGDKFGYAVAISGTTAVVGASYHHLTGQGYVFVKSAGTWVQQAKLLGSDSANGDSLGQAVAVSKSEVLIGAPDHAGGGAAYFFHRTGTTWSQQFELLGNHMGVAVGLSGGLAIVGAVDFRTEDTTYGDGAAYVYSYLNGNWFRRATLKSGATDDAFGESVAVSGDELAVGANLDGKVGGHVFVYRWTGTTAVLQAKLSSPGTSSKGFGYALALSGSSLVVGAPYGGDGVAFVYTLSGGAWKLQKRLLASDRHMGDQFASSVGISGNVACIGADVHGDHGTAYMFTRTGTAWAQTGEVVGSNTTPTDAFGASVAQSGNYSIVGAPNKDDSRGQAYVFSE
jgi:FG-GAP repeat